jgi:hypothetical protein
MTTHNPSNLITPAGEPSSVVKFSNTLEEYKKLMYDFSSPKRFGQGVWMMWMLMATDTDSEAERLYACKNFRKFARFCKCADCQRHCKKYIEDNPPENHVKEPDGLFNWVVTFMSTVNVRLGKPPYDVNILHHIFTDEEFAVCRSDCGGSGEKAEAKDSTSVANPDFIPLVPPKKDDRWIQQASVMFPGLIVKPEPRTIKIVPRQH